MPYNQRTPDVPASGALSVQCAGRGLALTMVVGFEVTLEQSCASLLFLALTSSCVVHDCKSIAAGDGCQQLLGQECSHCTGRFCAQVVRGQVLERYVFKLHVLY